MSNKEADLLALLSALQAADSRGDREAVKKIRRTIAVGHGADAYRDDPTGLWKVAGHQSAHGPKRDGEKRSDKDKIGMLSSEELERAKRKNQEYIKMYGGHDGSKFREAMLGGSAERSYEELLRRAKEEFLGADNYVRGWEDPREQLRKDMAESIRRGELRVPNPDVREEARRRMREFREMPGRPEWHAPPEWRLDKAEPPPPELPPDVHTPTVDESLAAIDELLKQEM